MNEGEEGGEDSDKTDRRERKRSVGICDKDIPSPPRQKTNKQTKKIKYTCKVSSLLPKKFHTLNETEQLPVLEGERAETLLVCDSAAPKSLSSPQDQTLCM